MDTPTASMVAMEMEILMTWKMDKLFYSLPNLLEKDTQVRADVKCIRAYINTYIDTDDA